MSSGQAEQGACPCGDRGHSTQPPPWTDSLAPVKGDLWHQGQRGVAVTGRWHPSKGLPCLPQGPAP